MWREWPSGVGHTRGTHDPRGVDRSAVRHGNVGKRLLPVFSQSALTRLTDVVPPSGPLVPAGTRMPNDRSICRRAWGLIFQTY
jgi:hypothetical protein